MTQHNRIQHMQEVNIRSDEDMPLDPGSCIIFLSKDNQSPTGETIELSLMRDHQKPPFFSF